MPIAFAGAPLGLNPKMANRHGLIAGATGTGKTVSLRVLAERFSDLGVPVFVADIKGDLGGLSQPGTANPKIEERINAFGLRDFAFAGFPVCFWDVFGEKGHPVRTTISEMGPLLLARLLSLNETQAGVLTLLFKYADDRGLLLLDLKDLRSLVQFAGDNAKELRAEYGQVSPTSVGAIQRALLALETGGGERLFGEPALRLDDLLRVGAEGRGTIHLLAADRLMQAPQTYATLLLWLLSELFEQLPEIGDPEKPRLVFFFDEAHLLFDELPKAIRDKVEQVVRLIRSKGVGVYFVTQSPLDIPGEILGQLGNRIQHALRAFTPRDQKAVKAAVQTFRQKPGLDLESAILELKVGEAIVSLLDDSGSPAPAERALIYPPRSSLAPLAGAAREQLIRRSPLYGIYEKTVDRESACERLKKAAQPAVQPPPLPPERPAPRPKAAPKSRAQTPGEAMVKSFLRSAGTALAGALVRGLLGSLKANMRRR
ncbi:MAG TPA: helicase HerA-like domain-containing protein [Chthoniobacterales bacterium]